VTVDDERLTLEELVVVLDIFWSTTILEDLKRTDNLEARRNLLIGMNEFHRVKGSSLDPDPYKFIGDGWVVLFPKSSTDGAPARSWRLCRNVR
jgi:hypothetical protein